MATTCCGQESYECRPRNDRRLQLIDQIREFIGDVEQEERSRGKGVRRGSAGGVSGGCSGSRARNMDEECRQYRKRRACTPPLITTIALHETRPTSNYSEKQHENSKQVTYVDATKEDKAFDPCPPAPWELPRTPSQELRAGNLYRDCECSKRNGLQQDCPRWDCAGRPECVATNPGPCCTTSYGRKPHRGDRRYAAVGANAQSQFQTKPTYSATCECDGPNTPNTPLQSKTPSQKSKTPDQSQHQFLGIMAVHSPAGMVQVTPTPSVKMYQQMTPSPPSGGQQTLAAPGLVCFCKPAM